MLGRGRITHGAQVAAAAFLVLAVAVDAGWAPLVDADTDVAGSLGSMVAGRGWLVDGLRLISAVCHPWVFRALAVLASAALFLRARRARAGSADRATTRRLAFFVVVTIGLSGLFSEGFKELVGRSRPSLANPVAHAAGPSFPSGHALTVMVAGIVLLAVLAVLTGRRPSAWAWAPVIVVVALTGFSRLGLGVHYLTDVLGGYLLGAAWALMMVSVFLPSAASRGDQR